MKVVPHNNLVSQADQIVGLGGYSLPAVDFADQQQKAVTVKTSKPVYLHRMALLGSSDLTKEIESVIAKMYQKKDLNKEGRAVRHMDDISVVTTDRKLRISAHNSWKAVKDKKVVINLSEPNREGKFAAESSGAV